MKFGRFRSYYWMQNRVATRFIGPVHERVLNPFVEGVAVRDRDWDTLIVLDACRADLFEDAIDLDQFDRYEVVKSIGSTSGQWYQRNFSAVECGDTVLVTANAHASTEAPNQFHDLIEVNRRWISIPDRNSPSGEEHRIFDQHPEDVYEEAVTAQNTYPNKRLIVRFMQPHIPFIATPELVFRRYRDRDDHDFGGRKDPIHVFEAFAHGNVSREQFWHGYRETLLLGFEFALKLIEHLDGKTVVTSDHGNMLGEQTWPVPIRLFSHPRGVRAPENVEVPWAVIEGGNRRDVVDGGVNSQTSLDEDEIEERLRDLGYR